jgi:hypothetical protein
MPDFDIGQQLHHIALPEPRDQGTLAGLISDLASTPLDHARPLWQVHVVDDVDGGSAVIMRIHHCIGDGTAAMVVCNELFGTASDVPQRAGGEDRGNVRSDACRTGLRPDREGHGLRSTPPDDARRRHPPDATGREGASSTRVDAAAELPRRIRVRPSRDRSTREARRWSEPVSLADVMRLAPSARRSTTSLAPRRARCARTALAASTWTRSAYGRSCRRSAPAGPGLELGNQFGLVILELPLEARRSRDRLRLTKQRMDALKRSPEPVAILALFDLFGRGPKAAGDLAVDLFGSKASLVMTNVAGPPQPVHLAGVPIDRLMFPHPGRQLGWASAS